MEAAIIEKQATKPKPPETDLMRRAVEDPRSALRSLIKNDLYLFLQYFWDTYTENTFVPNWHIEKISRELETIARRVANREPKLYDLVINEPPGTTKTALTSIIFPVWCWTNWYWMRFITTSHSDALSLESAEYSRDIIRSEKFRQLFPEIDIRQDKDQKSNFKIVKKQWASRGYVPRLLQGGSRISTSVGSKIIGFHAHLIIADDLIDPRRAISDAGIREANNYLDHTLSTRKVDKRVSTTILIMQRLAQNDPTGHLLSKPDAKIKHICLPGELRNYGDQLKPEKWREYYQDNLLDVRRMDWGVLKDMLASLGQYGYAGQVGQKPTLPEGGMFKVDRFTITDQVPSSHHIVRTVRYWDKAGTAGGGAYTAGVKMSRLDNGRYLVHDVRRGQWTSDERERIIRQTAEADDSEEARPTLIVIEQEGGSGGKESAEATMRNLAGFVVERDRPTGKKEARADPYSTQVNEGNVMLLRGLWNQAYIDELENFPNSTFKDQVDASSGAFAKLIGKKRVKIFRTGR